MTEIITFVHKNFDWAVVSHVWDASVFDLAVLQRNAQRVASVLGGTFSMTERIDSDGVTTEIELIIEVA